MITMHIWKQAHPARPGQNVPPQTEHSSHLKWSKSAFRVQEPPPSLSGTKPRFWLSHYHVRGFQSRRLTPGPATSLPLDIMMMPHQLLSSQFRVPWHFPTHRDHLPLFVRLPNFSSFESIPHQQRFTASRRYRDAEQARRPPARDLPSPTPVATERMACALMLGISISEGDQDLQDPSHSLALSLGAIGMSRTCFKFATAY
jgi:hypothetical protein